MILDMILQPLPRQGCGQDAFKTDHRLNFPMVKPPQFQKKIICPCL